MERHRRLPIWTGANGTAWVGQNNWVLAYAGTNHRLPTGDAVQFNDTAGTNAVTNTTVNISGANVSPPASLSTTTCSATR